MVKENNYGIQMTDGIVTIHQPFTAKNKRSALKIAKNILNDMNYPVARYKLDLLVTPGGPKKWVKF